MEELLSKIKDCLVCEEHLQMGPRPVLALSQNSRIIIIGQAPGLAVHLSGKPWDDKSGHTLRDWMGISDDQFYDENLVGILPMGFCYPGKEKSGDLPPRKECAPLWHSQLLTKIEGPQLVLLIGSYAQKYYLKENTHKNLSENVRNFKDFLPEYFVLPHPSPRNNIWQAKNPWFKEEILPVLKACIKDFL